MFLLRVKIASPGEGLGIKLSFYFADTNDCSPHPW